MEYTVEELIGMLNLSIIIANGNDHDNVSIPKNAAREISVYLEDLKNLLSE